MLINRIKSEIEKILKKNRFSETSIHNITDSDNPSRSSRKKNFEATLLFVDFSKAFDFIHRGKTN